MKKKLELYFHIPFCVKKCLYCDFLSAPCGEQTKDEYMEALLTELVGSAVHYQEYEIDTIFFGGGTPSVVEPFYIKRILDGVREHYDLRGDAEITIELNPGTVDREKLSIYKEAGVNRLSIGLQSASDEELKRLGRIHTWEAFLQTYHTARELGFDNINVDLMSALPGQTIESYQETLDKVLALSPRPEHISAYSLILEEGTPFYEMHGKGQIEFPGEEVDRQMYHLTKVCLAEAGYGRYEISNYALPGYECRHNIGYWNRTDYIGFGIGAASLFENSRFRNTDDINEYIMAPMEGKRDIEELTTQDCMEEYMYLGLRMTEGVSVGGFQAKFGVSMQEVYGSVIDKNKNEGLLEICPIKTEERLQLTELGLDVSNYVMAQFLLD